MVCWFLVVSVVFCCILVGFHSLSPFASWLDRFCQIHHVFEYGFVGFLNDFAVFVKVLCVACAVRCISWRVFVDLSMFV